MHVGPEIRCDHVSNIAITSKYSCCNCYGQNPLTHTLCFTLGSFLWEGCCRAACCSAPAAGKTAAGLSVKLVLSLLVSITTVTVIGVTMGGAEGGLSTLWCYN